MHVTHFNALMWDNGRAPVHVVEHGIPDPGRLYDGMLALLANLMRELVGPAWNPTEVLLPRAAPADDRPYREKQENSIYGRRAGPRLRFFRPSRRPLAGDHRPAPLRAAQRPGGGGAHSRHQ